MKHSRYDQSLIILYLFGAQYKVMLLLADLCITTTCPMATECHTPQQCNPATGKCEWGNKPYAVGTACTYRCATNTVGKCPGSCAGDGTCKPFPGQQSTMFSIHSIHDVCVCVRMLSHNKSSESVFK